METPLAAAVESTVVEPNVVEPVTPVTLEYATLDTHSLAALAPGLRLMTAVALLSGLCVASCFLVMYTAFNTLAVVAHVCLYAMTIALAVLAGVRWSSVPLLRSEFRMTLDAVAAIGLAGLGIAPVVAPRGGTNETDLALLGLAFGLMAFTAPRHLLLYRVLGGHFRDGGFVRTARTLTGLGWVKTVYEAAWLACCCAPLLLSSTHLAGRLDDVIIFIAFTALFGCGGYGVIWLLMIVVHWRAARLAGRLAQGASVAERTGPTVCRTVVRQKVVSLPESNDLIERAL